MKHRSFLKGNALIRAYGSDSAATTYHQQVHKLHAYVMTRASLCKMFDTEYLLYVTKKYLSPKFFSYTNLGT